MDRIAANSYYLAYNSIQRFASIVFIHNYFLTWSIALFTSLFLPALFALAPSALHTKRTSYFVIICIICLANMFLLYGQIYLVSGSGEPNLSFHTCRFVVYISTLAKPIGIYLTLIFSLERFMQKILPHFIIRRQLFQRLFQLLILLGLISISAVRLYEVLKLISSVQQTSTNDDPSNATDLDINFEYCFQSVNADDYARILSFYVIQYWFEYTALILILLISISIIIQQYRLPISSSRFSVNTKFYLSLAVCLITWELILFFFHLIVKSEKYKSTDFQATTLKAMLFMFNFRCVLLPCVICLILCDPMKKFFYELIITRPYLENIDENDAIEQHSEPFSAPQRTRHRLQQKFRRTSNKNNNQDNHVETSEQPETPDGL